MYNTSTIRRFIIAKIIDSDIESLPVNKLYPVWRIALVGMILGVLYWCFTALMLRYTDSISVAGNIATILVATLGTIILLNLHMARPLLIVLASAVSLWGLEQLTNGLGWVEIIAWSALLYGLSYTLFSWLTRYKRILPVLIATIVIVAILRITITL